MSTVSSVRPKCAVRRALLGVIACSLVVPTATAEAQHAVRRGVDGPPSAVVDLRTRDGIRLVRGQWRTREAAVELALSKAPGPDLRASGPTVTTRTVSPSGNVTGADDTGWEAIEPDALETRRTNGHLAFTWYRLTVTIPERVGDVPTAGSTVVFEVVVDDYAEVWVDGRLPRALGQRAGPLIAGFNAPNRVILTTDARPGQQIRLAVFGANGPLSDPPSNFIWIRSATLDFYPPGATQGVMTPAVVARRDPALDEILPPGTMLEKLAGGFLFTEGPVWHPDGYLLFSDPNANAIYRWSDADGLSVYRPKSGYTGADIGEYKQPGSNGLAIDADGRLTIAEHGNRRVTRVERTGAVTVLADRFEGARLNSPNDLVYRSDGTAYFTDPPFGLPRAYDDAGKELPHSGVYLWANGSVRLVSTDLRGPNGVALSPDEAHLYVGNWDELRKVVMRYDVRPDGSLANPVVFADLTSAPGEDAIDGVKVDMRGNVYVSGPGGVWIYSKAGTLLGTLSGPEHPHNMAWGGDDGRTLYLTSQTGLYRVRLGVQGHRPFVQARPTTTAARHGIAAPRE